MSPKELLDLPNGYTTTTFSSESFAVEVFADETHGPLCRRFLAGERLPCFLGLSPETSYSNRGQLTAILRWLGARSESIVVLEGSYFSRWDLMVFESMSSIDAEKHVQRRVQQFERRLRDVSQILGLTDVVVPLVWPEVLELEETQSIQKKLRSYADENQEFSADIDEMLTEFLMRVRPTAQHSLSSGQRVLLKNYIFEELSLFLHLCRIGYPLEVYPGSDLEIMQRIAGNGYPDFPVSCPNRSHLSIRLARHR